MVGNVLKFETSSGGGTLVIICSRGNLSILAGADVGLDASAGCWSIAVVDRAGAAKLSKKDGPRGVVLETSSVAAAGALSGEPFWEVCCDCDRGSIDRLRGSWRNADWLVRGRWSTDRRGISVGWWILCDRGIVYGNPHLWAISLCLWAGLW